jgi:predicted nucleic acid-binding protein
MIAVDTSSMIAFLQGQDGRDTQAISDALQNDSLHLPPVVVTELLSDPKASGQIRELIGQLPQLSLSEGYWSRAGQSRQKLLLKGYKARLGDALIAQACMDNNVPLITRAPDFRHFVNLCGLRLA